MAYAVFQDALDLYGRDYVLTSIDRDDDGTPDLTSLTAALDQASSEIDSYLRSRYPVPLDPVPSLVKRYAIDIALYLCSPDPAAATDEKRRRYEDAIRWLEKVAEGKLSLGAEEPTVDSSTPQLSYCPRRFSRTSMRGLL